MIKALKIYNWGALSFDIKLCKTNLPSRSAMRAPGELQGSYIAEAVIEHVASFLSVEVDCIRGRNMHTYESLKLFYGGSFGEPNEYTLPLVVDKLIKSSRFDQRLEEMRRFNGCNVWKKRGISCVPIVHEVMLKPTPGKVGVLNDGSVVVEVGGLELGQGLWTKVKQMAPFALGPLDRSGSKDLLVRIRVIQADTLSVVQGGITSGSTTSELSCEAVRLCCNVLVERLNPLKERLEKEMGGPISWETLIFQAGIDLLTGATSVLQTDIIYDCGQSLNPTVDLGQIEGAFVQGIGFFMLEEYLENSDGLIISDETWTYKIPTIDTTPKQFNVEILNSGHWASPKTYSLLQSFWGAAVTSCSLGSLCDPTRHLRS